MITESVPPFDNFTSNCLDTWFWPRLVVSRRATFQHGGRQSFAVLRARRLDTPVGVDRRSAGRAATASTRRARGADARSVGGAISVGGGASAGSGPREGARDGVGAAGGARPRRSAPVRSRDPDRRRWRWRAGVGPSPREQAAASPGPLTSTEPSCIVTVSARLWQSQPAAKRVPVTWMR